jgi:pimeloyl-ACP methyl ester carboxylesterase
MGIGLLGTRTKKIKNPNGTVVSESITSLEKVMLGNLNQYILLRGKNKNNPILLFLHGGPGSAQIGFAPRYQQSLEDDFVVVNWDQRGAGKSYSKNISKATMTLEHFISDANELVDYLCTRFGKEKIYLAGHSWGSILGSMLVYRYPEKFNAYIGIGQVVNMNDNERVSYEYVLKEAKKANNKRAVKSLGKIGEPPYKNEMKDLMTQRKWLGKFKGEVYEKKLFKEIALHLLSSQEYSLSDSVKMLKGNKFSLKHMWSTLMSFDIIKEVPEIKIPAYFCIGRHDYNTPFELSYKYYQTLKSPHKEYIWFEKSAHYPIFEEPEKFSQVLKRILIETESI